MTRPDESDILKRTRASFRKAELSEELRDEKRLESLAGRISNLETRNSNFETRNSKLETRNPKPGDKESRQDQQIVPKVPVTEIGRNKLNRLLRKIPKTSRFGTIAYALSKIQGGKVTGMALLAMAARENGEFEPVILAWNEMSSEKRKNSTINDICDRVGVKPKKVMGAIAEQASEFSFDMARMMAGLAQPKVMQAAIECASKPVPRAFNDRQMLLQQAGHAPIPRGSEVRVYTQVNQESVAFDPGKPPDFERDTVESCKAMRQEEIHVLPESHFESTRS